MASSSWVLFCFSYHVGVPSRGVPSVGFPQSQTIGRLSWRPTNHKSHRPLQCHCMPPPPNSKWIEKICSHDLTCKPANTQGFSFGTLLFSGHRGRVCAELPFALKGIHGATLSKCKCSHHRLSGQQGRCILPHFEQGQFTMALHLLTTLAIIQQ